MPLKRILFSHREAVQATPSGLWRVLLDNMRHADKFVPGATDLYVRELSEFSIDETMVLDGKHMRFLVSADPNTLTLTIRLHASQPEFSGFTAYTILPNPYKTTEIVDERGSEPALCYLEGTMNWIAKKTLLHEDFNDALKRLPLKLQSTIDGMVKMAEEQYDGPKQEQFERDPRRVEEGRRILFGHHDLVQAPPSIVWRRLLDNMRHSDQFVPGVTDVDVLREINDNSYEVSMKLRGQPLRFWVSADKFTRSITLRLHASQPDFGGTLTYIILPDPSARIEIFDEGSEMPVCVLNATMCWIAKESVPHDDLERYAKDLPKTLTSAVHNLIKLSEEQWGGTLKQREHISGAHHEAVQQRSG